ncbi:MAG: PilW family protein [Candidatus Rokuibacteriota bacterium]
MRRHAGNPVRSERGITLTELAVTLAIFGLIMIGVVGTWQKTQEAYFVGSEAAEVQQNVRAAIDFMVRELRATGRDVTVCAFDYDQTGGAVLDCTATKAANCDAKLPGAYTTCANVFAMPVADMTPTRIRIRSDRNDNGTIANGGNGDQGDEDVTYQLTTGGACTGAGQCITRTTAGGGAVAMVAVDINGLTFTYYPRPSYPPCDAVPPQSPCPSFVPATQRDADNVGRIQISVTAQTALGGISSQVISRTLVTDVTLKNRY